MKKTDIKPGTRFGYWTVIAPPDVSQHDYVRCRCICGKEKLIYVYNLIQGKSLSCGCKRKEGDSLVLKDGRYRAYISIDKKQIHLGFFDKLDDAKAARKAAEQRYFADRQEKADEIKEQIKKDSSK